MVIIPWRDVANAKGAQLRRNRRKVQHRWQTELEDWGRWQSSHRSSTLSVDTVIVRDLRSSQLPPALALQIEILISLTKTLFNGEFTQNIYQIFMILKSKQTISITAQILVNQYTLYKTDVLEKFLLCSTRYSTVSLKRSPMIWTAPKYNFKLLNSRSYRILLGKCTQTLPSTKIFLLEESWFILGYFWRKEKVQSSQSIRKDRLPIIILALPTRTVWEPSRQLALGETVSDCRRVLAV